MMDSHEKKDYADYVHLLMAFKRTKDKEKATSIRTIIKDYDTNLALLEYRCKLLGGEWRIHHTVNPRDTEKARKWLIHKLIDFPEGRGFIDSLWRTALLQPENIFGEKKFLLDIDTKDFDCLNHIENLLPEGVIVKQIESPSGWHYISKPFDTRELCKLQYVTLIRDGYYFIKKVGAK